MNGTAKALKDEGQPAEAHCPSHVGDPAAGWKPPSGLQVFRRVSEPMSADAAEVERAIRAGGVPVLGISLPEPFFVPLDPWVIVSGGAIRGLHAVAGVGVGHHRGSRVILIRNSWGTEWGAGGYAWLDDTFVAHHLREVLLVTHEVA
jgi:hypothetical protein